MMGWQIAAIAVDVFFAAVIIVLEVITVKKFFKRRSEGAKA